MKSNNRLFCYWINRRECSVTWSARFLSHMNHVSHKAQGHKATLWLSRWSGGDLTRRLWVQFPPWSEFFSVLVWAQFHNIILSCDLKEHTWCNVRSITAPKSQIFWAAHNVEFHASVNYFTGNFWNRHIPDRHHQTKVLRGLHMAMSCGIYLILCNS